MPNTAPSPPIDKWENVKTPTAAVHIVHGMAEHPGRYDRLARAFNAAGIIVWAHHQRGHGRNPEPGIRGHFGDNDGWKALVDDAWSVSAQLKAAHDLPLILFAHSMGSFVGQRVMAEHGGDYKGVIFCGTNGAPTLQEGILRTLAWSEVFIRSEKGRRAQGLRWRKRVIVETYNKPFASTVPPSTWLSRDEDEVRKYDMDPSCDFTLSYQAWFDLLKARADQSDASFFAHVPSALPIRVIAGTDDPVGEMGDGVRRLLATFAEAGLSCVSHCFYAGARHELVNETNRDDVTKDLIGFIDDVVHGRCPRV